MTNVHRRWELGSEFHWQDWVAPSAPACFPVDSLLFGSGRDALKTLLRHGKIVRHWQRIWVPSYYCQEVIESIRESDIQIEIYSDSPLESSLDLQRVALRPFDAVLIVNYFGLRAIDDVFNCLCGIVDVIEDHTHDPWSAWARNSKAEWCFASLRKTLPIPDGAILWSPHGLKLPASVATTEPHESNAQLKLAAMLLKGVYLNGHNIDKERFRETQIRAEAAIAKGDVSGISSFTRAVLPLFPVMQWRAIRQSNIQKLGSSLACTPIVRLLLLPDANIDRCPFGAILLFDDAAVCSSLRAGLIKQDIYPAVLWPQDRSTFNIDADAVALSQRMLMIHCDWRYSHSDMERVASVVMALLMANEHERI